MDQNIIKIMICGEDTQTAKFLRTALASKVYIFQYCENIEKCIQNISPGDYNVILISLSSHAMKGNLAGISAIPILKKIDPNLLIIAIANDDSLEGERKARMAGIFYYLTKPLDKNEVQMAVANAVQKFEKLF